jgi:hypothetical protein
MLSEHQRSFLVLIDPFTSLPTLRPFTESLIVNPGLYPSFGVGVVHSTDLSDASVGQSSVLRSRCWRLETQIARSIHTVKLSIDGAPRRRHCGVVKG